MAAAAAAAAMEAEEMKTVVVVGMDESEHSEYALEWTLRRFFCGPSSGSFKLVVVHAKPSPSSFVSFGNLGAAEIFPIVDEDLKKVAQMVVEKARKLCLASSVSALVEVVEGDARNALCDAAEKHHADMLVVGSHGYGAIKRAFLGSVSDYCTHQAQCSVVIVKKLKQNK